MGTVIKNLEINEDEVFSCMECGITNGNFSPLKELIREEAERRCCLYIESVLKHRMYDSYDDISEAKELTDILLELSYENLTKFRAKIISIVQSGKIEEIIFGPRDESSHMREFSISLEDDFLEIARILQRIQSPQVDAGVPRVELITVSSDGITVFQSETVNDLIVKWRNQIDVPSNDDEIDVCSLGGTSLHFNTFGDLMYALTGNSSVQKRTRKRTEEVAF